MSKQLTIGFSPCPNDTFIFDALIHGKIDTDGIDFEVVLADVEELNEKAFNADLDITKISYHAFGYLTNDYVLLDAGSALGKGCGPLLVRKKGEDVDLQTDKIAIPGKYTTANFLFSLAHPEALNKTEMLFSDIENAVIQNHVQAGLIIHENRFTYEDKGLEKIVDLGQHWEDATGHLIPLGGIIIKRNLDEETIQTVNRLIRKSIEFAFANPKEALGFMKSNAQEMDEEVMRQHIELYVNEYSLDLGEQGKAAINQMFNLAQEKEIIPTITKPIFVS